MSQVYEKALALVGEEAEPNQGLDEVNKAMIRHWCEAMEDGNPLYTDEDYAAQSEYGGIIAPPQMVMSYCMVPLWPKSEGAPDPFGTAVKLMNEAGYFGIVATKTFYEFLKPMHPGDRLSIKISLASVSSEKKTRLGKGHFLTAEHIFTNQRSETVCVQSFTVFTFKPAAQA